MATNPILTLLGAAYSQLGVPYVWADSNPRGPAGGSGAGFDCSGLTMWAASQVGVSLPHQSGAQYSSLPHLTRNELRPGDLVFFSYGRTGPGNVDHVGIYLGGGMVLDAASSTHPVEVGPMDWSNFVGGGDIYSRLGKAAQPPSASDLKQLANKYNAGNGYNPGQTPGGRAAQRQSNQNDTMSLRWLLQGYGLNPDDFMDLIRQAVVNNWSTDAFAARVYNSKTFKDTFPGIFNSDGSLKMTPGEYQQLIYSDNGYASMAKEYGIKFDRDRFGALIGKNVSPTEWAYRLQVAQRARSTEVERQSFNDVLRRMGQKPLDPSNWAHFLEGKTNTFVEKLYTATSLDAAKGLDLNAKQALHTASVLQREVGSSDPSQIGEIDVQALVAQARALKDQIGPELRAAGITDSDLSVLAANADPKNQRQMLEQILRTRGSLGTGGGAAGSPTTGLFSPKASANA